MAGRPAVGSKAQKATPSSRHTQQGGACLSENMAPALGYKGMHYVTSEDTSHQQLELGQTRWLTADEHNRIKCCWDKARGKGAPCEELHEMSAC